MTHTNVPGSPLASRLGAFSGRLAAMRATSLRLRKWLWESRPKIAALLRGATSD